MRTRAAVYGLPQSDMHELGLIIEVVEHVERIATEQHFNAVSEVELHIGESFNIVPSLMRNVYKQASVGTVMENSSLIIQVIKASARCNRCKTVFNPLQTGGICKCCGESDYTVISGKEFLINSIKVADNQPEYFE